MHDDCRTLGFSWELLLLLQVSIHYLYKLMENVKERLVLMAGETQAFCSVS